MNSTLQTHRPSRAVEARNGVDRDVIRGSDPIRISCIKGLARSVTGGALAWQADYELSACPAPAAEAGSIRRAVALAAAPTPGDTEPVPRSIALRTAQIHGEISLDTPAACIDTVTLACKKRITAGGQTLRHRWRRRRYKGDANCSTGSREPVGAAVIP